MPADPNVEAGREKRVDLRERHGTPAEFEQAVWRAWDFLTYDEQIAGIKAYRARWEAAE